MNALYVAWHPTEIRAGWRPIGRLEYDSGIYRFFYTQGAKKPGFRLLTQMEDLEQIYESANLFPIFTNRLLSKNRPEYEDFLRWSGFESAHPPDPISILGVTEGIRATDAIEVFPCPQPNSGGCYISKFFLHGVRWQAEPALARIEKLQPGEKLKLMPDPQNSYDPNAVAVRTEDDPLLIGYIPRYLAHDVWELFRTCEVEFIQLSVERVNSRAPMQNRVLCRMQACWPEGFRPCSSEDFLPIPNNVAASCLDQATS